ARGAPRGPRPRRQPPRRCLGPGPGGRPSAAPGPPPRGETPGPGRQASPLPARGSGPGSRRCLAPVLTSVQVTVIIQLSDSDSIVVSITNVSLPKRGGCG